MGPGEYLLTSKEGGETRPLRRVIGRANLGYWHPSTMDMILSGVTDSHPVFKRSPVSPITNQDKTTNYSTGI